MLLELSISDLALIERAELTLGKGLNAVTGETGTGKSLLVTSLELIRGETPRGGAAQWIRKGARTARVEGRFVLSERGTLERVRATLWAELPEIAEDVERELSDHPDQPLELILGRTLTAEGRTRAHVNQRPVPLKALGRLAEQMLEIHGQNDHQRLLETAEQRRLLDAFGGHAQTLATYRGKRAAWAEGLARLRSLRDERDSRRERAELLRFQREELAAAELQSGEHEALLEERELLRSAGDLGQELGGLVDQLREAEDSQLDRLRSAQRTLERWTARLPRLSGAYEDISSAAIHVEEAASALGSLLDNVEADPARLEFVETRLDELERLAHKYRTDEAGLTVELGRIEAELGELEGTDDTIGTLEQEVAVLAKATHSAAADLSKKRKALAPRLAKEIRASLATLGLERAVFQATFSARTSSDELERFGPDGAEDVEFLLAANPGEDKHPLRRVASGGEAARIMLALRTVLSTEEGGRTLVFDEIDSGVGGRLGPEVGSHLRSLGERHQVICVTHLPPIAAVADTHLHTFKEVHGGRTTTTIAPLQGEERVSEVADMISGGASEETARAEARRLLATASRS